ncbi:hypothetical protein THOM_1489 [Trachipleistophora hominis]|uniref:Uncharacterized protein n=1 Tax=Trachipleistophora hominis TaxID=72359 RepID=L7JWW9_TRAHO|nr:hypothetical protein THOM_1489 [Trachipleistophora hominis]
MDKIEFPLIFSLFIVTVICSNYESAIFNDPELNYTEIVNTNTVGYQVTKA